MPKSESEKIDCSHRLCSSPAPRGKIESVLTHSDVIEQFYPFSLLKLLFLVRNWHCWSRKALLANWHLIAEKKLRRRPFFHKADGHEKLCGRSLLYTSVQERHETGGVFSLFSSLSFDIEKSVKRWSLDVYGLFSRWFGACAFALFVTRVPKGHSLRVLILLIRPDFPALRGGTVPLSAGYGRC